MRTIKTIGIVIGLYLSVILISASIYILNPNVDDGLVEGFGTVIFLALLGTLARKVGYRWFDCLFVLIPFYGLIWLFRIAYRIAYLPQVDWNVFSVGETVNT